MEEKIPFVMATNKNNYYYIKSNNNNVLKPTLPNHKTLLDKTDTP